MSTQFPASLPSFRGQLITPSHSGYDDARAVWKGIERRPAAIARCSDVDDVRRIVEYAGEHGMPLAVVGAGHDVAARSMADGELVLSTAALTNITVDRDHRTVRVEPGVHWGSLVREAAEHGLATTGASVATVGVTGFLLHGGFGWLMRSCGAGCDNVLELEVTTADAQPRTINAETNSDLHWAMRGAGSNYGVVTALTLQLHPVSRVTAGVILYPAEKARQVVEAYRLITSDAPDELVTHFYYVSNTDGTHNAGIGVCFRGDTAGAHRALASLDAIDRSWRDSLREMNTVGLQAVHDSSTPIGGQYHVRANYLSEISDEAIDVLLERCRTITAPLTKVFIEHLGGAVRKPVNGATAFANRDSSYSFLAVAGWTNGSQTYEHVEWVRALGDAMRAHASDGAYVNYLDDDEDHRVPEAYGEAYARLRSIKQQYDPTNMFRFNRNIPPASDPR